MSPDDAGTGVEAVRVDAPPAPSASVTSAPSAPAPPTRSRRRSVSSAGGGAPESVSMPVDSIAEPAAPVAEPTVAGFAGVEETARPARRGRAVAARAPASAVRRRAHHPS